MPSKKLGVTYLFSNGFVTVVYNVIFDIMQTSYSFVDADEATFRVNGPDQWGSGRIPLS